MKRVTTILLIQVGILLAGSHSLWAGQREESNHTIVPGVRVGDYTFGMSKDDVLKKMGEPQSIFWGSETYTLDNLPTRYFMVFGDISFSIDGDRVTGMTVRSTLCKFVDGLGVGDSEEKIKQAFGENFHLGGGGGKIFLTYEDKGLSFEIDEKSRTVMEINVTKIRPNQSENAKVYRRDDIEAYENVSGKDLRACDLRDSGDILDTLEFNQETLWPPPERLPKGFDPKTLLEEGMNPGLGVRDLHAQGITGAGVHVGLIDQPLRLDHPEYAGKIVSYYALDCGPHKSSMHGPGMASQLVGNRCGTAPDASLHVVAVPSWKADASYYARALDRFVAYNESVPKEQKIRVVSVSCQPSGEGSIFKNQSLWDEAVQRAQDKGILVLDCTWHHGFVSLCWLDPKNRESVEACTPGFRNGPVEVDEGHIHVPSAPRTVAQADEDGSFGYAYDGGGGRSRRPKAKNGYSDTIPYAAGILALGWQIRPDLTPAQMKKLLFASAYVHQSGAKIIHPTAFIDLVRGQSSHPVSGGVNKEDSETLTIVPGAGVGNYKLGMSKDEVLSKLGEPQTIQFGEDEVVRRGEKKYDLNDLPREYVLSFNDVSFWFENDSVQVISVRTPLYRLGNGLGVGDSEQKTKQAFGEDFKLEEAFGKEFCCYHAKGIGFEIHKKNRTVTGIVVYRTEGGGGDPNVPDSAEAALVRKAAAEGRIAYKLTTPEEFKAIAGRPTRERTESNGEVICMEYPGIQARFFGKPRIQTPHTLVSISCEGRGIDIGQNRRIVLRNEGDLDKLGSFWGFSDVDLSRLDLSQKGDLLDRTTFDSLTVWPASDHLPRGFDPAKRLEWGKNPGLGIRSLHQEGITGKGVGIAIIDQPLLKDHIEYADRIKSYHAIEVEGADIQMHGPPVCSIAVGKTCGVAPEANLHYYAVPPWKWLDDRPWARTVEQIVDRNRDLPPSEKVRVISISLGAFSRRDYYDRWRSAVEKAYLNGILVVTCDDRDFMPYVTLERLVGTDSDDPNNYFDSGVDALYVPASNRSIASHRGKDVYTFDTHGGNSWTVPYLAGLAAMAFQIHPQISPERIVALFQETATQTKQGRVINPRGFVEAIKGIKAQSLL
jgi:serine protease AprX